MQVLRRFISAAWTGTSDQLGQAGARALILHQTSPRGALICLAAPQCGPRTILAAASFTLYKCRCRKCNIQRTQLPRISVKENKMSVALATTIVDFVRCRAHVSVHEVERANCLTSPIQNQDDAGISWHSHTDFMAAAVISCQLCSHAALRPRQRKSPLSQRPLKASPVTLQTQTGDLTGERKLHATIASSFQA